MYTVTIMLHPNGKKRLAIETDSLTTAQVAAKKLCGLDTTGWLTWQETHENEAELIAYNKDLIPAASLNSLREETK